MKLKDLASKPQLTQILLNDDDIVSQFGEPLEFYTWDKQPMETFLKIARSNRDDYGAIIEAVKDLILDEAGQPVMTDGFVLPGPVLVKAVNAIIDRLGK